MARLIDFFKNIRKLISFDIAKSIIFFAGYPFTSRLADGYYQRVFEIDSLLGSRCKRIYVDKNFSNEQNSWLSQVDETTIVIGYYGGAWKKAILNIILYILIIISKRIYIHSALRLEEAIPFIRIPFVNVFFDLHGAVPEEADYLGDYKKKIFYNYLERIAVEQAAYVIVVSVAMKNYLAFKYPDVDLNNKFIILPIFKSHPVNYNRALTNRRPVIIYSGGVQKWQQALKIVELINSTSKLYRYTICTADPIFFRSHISVDAIEQDRVDIDCLTNRALMEKYTECDYGLILRKDHILNRVSCPTKLIEYLCMGVIPVFDSDNIGDFKKMGVQFISCSALYRNALPSIDARMEMVHNNYKVYERFLRIQGVGKLSLIKAIFGDI